MNLVFNYKLIITDSGGLQEETTYLGISCLTMRPNTERPITISQGTNRLCKTDDLEAAVEDILQGNITKGKVSELWDGKAADRVVLSLQQFFNK